MHTKLMQTGQVEKEKEHIRYNLIISVILFIYDVLLTTFINGGAFCYSFVFMLIRPTRLTLV